MKTFLINKFLPLFSILLTIFGLQGCKADDDLIMDIPASVTIKVGESVNLANTTYDKDELIIPFVEVYTVSGDDNIAKVEELKVNGVGLGTTTIFIYKDENLKNLIKKVNVTVVPTASITMTCGQQADVLDYLDLDPGHTYNSEFEVNGKNVVMYDKLKIYAILPGTANVIYESHTKGPYLIQVTVNRYTGAVPFTNPISITPRMTQSEVMERMKLIMDDFGESYTLMEGVGTLNYHTQKTLTYSPYGNSESITFYFYNDYNIYGIEKGQLSGFIITPTASPADVIGYILSNYDMISDMFDRNPILGLRDFRNNHWFVSTTLTGNATPWSDVIFNYQ